MRTTQPDAFPPATNTDLYLPQVADSKRSSLKSFLLKNNKRSIHLKRLYSPTTIQRPQLSDLVYANLKVSIEAIRLMLRTPEHSEKCDKK